MQYFKCKKDYMVIQVVNKKEEEYKLKKIIKGELFTHTELINLLNVLYDTFNVLFLDINEDILTKTEEEKTEILANKIDEFVKEYFEKVDIEKGKTITVNGARYIK